VSVFSYLPALLSVTSAPAPPRWGRFFGYSGGSYEMEAAASGVGPVLSDDILKFGRN
jgi:hypothetical protein